jgi:hypothetical protein
MESEKKDRTFRTREFKIEAVKLALQGRQCRRILR